MVKKSFLVVAIFTLTLGSYGQKYKYPGPLQIRDYKIGDKVDTSLFIKYEHMYLPNFLDGWTMDNYVQTPEYEGLLRYQGYPVAVWKMKKDTNIVMTLLNDIILNITILNISEKEITTITNMVTNSFGDGEKENYYEQTPPGKSWTAYWTLKTWQMSDVIVQIGYRSKVDPKDLKPKRIKWDLVYSDFLLENRELLKFKFEKQ